MGEQWHKSTFDSSVYKASQAIHDSALFDARLLIEWSFIGLSC